MVRELSEEMVEELQEHTGTCRFCKQIHVIGYENGDCALELIKKGMAPMEALNEQATRQCTCNEGLHYRRGIKQAEEAEEECKKLFADLPEAQAVISTSVLGLAVGKLKAISLNVETADGSVKASARRTTKGGIEMKRTAVTEEGVSV
ncbi:MAG: hypothetical protein IK115_07790 [Lachnospiraceae bacterium]|nr:hypothetical protein [Lachnospiraceae bacterium]